MSQEEFDPTFLLEHAIDFGKKIILSRENELTAQVMIYSFAEKGLSVAVMLLALDKDFWPELIQRGLEEFGGFSYVLLTEAWMSIPTGNPAQSMSTMAAMKHSSLKDLDVPKQEVLMAQYSGPDGSRMLSVEIKPGRKSFGEPLMLVADGNEVSGRMVNVGGVSSVEDQN